MIEVNLYSVPANEISAKVGRCVARSRFDKEAMGTTVEKFVMAFLRDNLEKFEAKINDKLVEIINSTSTFTRRDISCINYYLSKHGYILKIYNVTDDEENALGIPSGEVVEWNIIDYNFMQNDYPTATKIIPGTGDILDSTIADVVEQASLFNKDKFAGLKNPFTDLIENIKRIKTVNGSINPSLVGKIYDILSQAGVEIFCATSEE